MVDLLLPSSAATGAVSPEKKDDGWEATGVKGEASRVVINGSCD